MLKNIKLIKIQPQKEMGHYEKNVCCIFTKKFIKICVNISVLVLYVPIKKMLDHEFEIFRAITSSLNSPLL